MARSPSLSTASRAPATRAEVADLLDIPAGYGSRGAFLDPSDAPAVQRLLTACRDELALSCFAGRSVDPVRLLESGAHGTWNAPEEDRCSIGFFDHAGEPSAFVQVVRRYPERDTWCIAALVVRPDLRGCGVGAAIVDAVERWAAAEGARALHLHVARHDAGALQFALRSGFHRRGEAPLRDVASPARLAVLARPVA